MLRDKKNFTILFNGDSITNGARGLNMDCNHIMGHGYQEMCAAEIGKRFIASTPKFYTKGVSGQNLAGMYANWEEDCFRFSPDIITVLIGINDSLTFDPENWEKTYRKMIEETRERLPESVIILMEPFYIGFPPASDAFDYVPHPLCEKGFGNGPCCGESEENIRKREASLTEMRTILDSIVSDYKLDYVKLQGLFDDAIKANGIPPRYLIWDGVHPTIVGHRLIADKLTDTIIKYI